MNGNERRAFRGMPPLPRFGGAGGSERARVPSLEKRIAGLEAANVGAAQQRQFPLSGEPAPVPAQHRAAAQDRCRDDRPDGPRAMRHRGEACGVRGFGGRLGARFAPKSVIRRSKILAPSGHCIPISGWPDQAAGAAGGIGPLPRRVNPAIRPFSARPHRSSPCFREEPGCGRRSPRSSVPARSPAVPGQLASHGSAGRA